MGEARRAGSALSPAGPLEGPFVVLNGPSGLDDPDPDILVLPAEDFLALAGGGLGAGIRYFAYGPVSLMEKAFEVGCSDYLREPWSLSELRARVGRYCHQKFRAQGGMVELRGRNLKGPVTAVELSESECALLGLFLANAPRPVPWEAAAATIPRSRSANPHALSRSVQSLRRKMDSVEPGLGGRLRAIRGFGYRLDASACG